ncbi:methyltransferase domain-containing protein [Actinomyces vulturis]|uniref:methyltransferase domain-containing protein n=1 Tax=Actinomyces vulturis TaxID=1857645 RepID=UPI0008318CDA|nr:methyltransferase domain-containing protein [Actinomyces vulturis]
MNTGYRPLYPESVTCHHHQSGECRSCPTLSMPRPEQVSVIDEQVRLLLTEHIPAQVWDEPLAGESFRIRNKAKFAVFGTADNPQLGIAALVGKGRAQRTHFVDLGDCPLHEPAIERAVPAIREMIRECALDPYDIIQRTGELKYVLVTASPEERLMVRLVLRGERCREAIVDYLPRALETIPGLEVLSLNYQPQPAAIVEGEREEVLTAPETLTMRLSLPDVEPGTLINPQMLVSSANGVEVISHGAGDVLQQETRSQSSGGGEEEGHRVQRGSGDEVNTVAMPLVLPTQSFFQTNTLMATGLYAQARSWAWEGLLAQRQGWSRGSSSQLNVDETTDDGANRDEPTRGAENVPLERAEADTEPIRIWDLYCGVGGFALALAAQPPTDIPVEVRGVELSAPAIAGATKAATTMGLTAPSVQFASGDASVIDPARSAHLPDLLVVNPPRRGIGEDLAQRINDSGIPLVVYSSCSPQSLAKDLELLSNYVVAKARIVDMFPHTTHAEVLLLLERRDVG